MKEIKGDLIQLAKDGQFNVIIHGCNCFCAMGAGIAAAIREDFPEAFTADLETPMGDRQKLGGFSLARVRWNSHFFTIVNGYTQYHYSGQGPLVDYDAVQLLFSKIKKKFTGAKIAYPKIGAGLGKGNWDKISRIINDELKGENHTFVRYSRKQ